MKAVCDRHGALLILDEVMCGMGRTGTMHAWQQLDVIPDIQTMGKGLGGGFLPIAALLINAKVVAGLQRGSGRFSHGQTYQGHPVACAAALAVQKTIRKANLLANVQEMGTLLHTLLLERLGSHPNVGDIRGMGLFWGLEFVEDKVTKEPFDPALGISLRIHETALAPPYSISLYPGSGTVDGIKGDHILLAPPFNVTREEIEMIVDLTARVIEDVFSEIRAATTQMPE